MVARPFVVCVARDCSHTPDRSHHGERPCSSVSSAKTPQRTSMAAQAADWTRVRAAFRLACRSSRWWRVPARGGAWLPARAGVWRSRPVIDIGNSRPLRQGAGSRNGPAARPNVRISWFQTSRLAGCPVTAMGSRCGWPGTGKHSAERRRERPQPALSQLAAPSYARFRAAR
jgi:hypothetical protein